MIPSIGLMIGSYIFVRVLEIITRPANGRHAAARGFIILFGILSMIATVFICLDLFFGSLKTAGVPGLLP